ncbi:MAG: flagellar hook-basal body complex protein FliE [Phycisphaerae bacterium]|nr:flagellar hook-basal body complex protein FliE [Phycisphaerae bacterium]
MADSSISASVSGVSAGGGPFTLRAPGGGSKSDEIDFKSQLVESLEKVSRLQQEADVGVQRLLTGESDNVSEVLATIRKADVAFSLLMEIRNKLLDAYNELRQMRV